MKRVAFAVTYPESLVHPLHREVARSDGVSRMELLTWGPTAAVTTLSWFDADPGVVADLLDAVESATTTSLVAGDGGSYAFVRQTAFEFADELLAVLGESAVAFLPPVVFHEDRSATFEAVGDPVAVSAFHDRLRDLVPTTVDRVHDFRRGAASAEVTARQEAALATAADLGYYEVPRTATVDDVAAELGCASSTAGELLRKAEAGVIGGYLSGDGGEQRR